MSQEIVLLWSAEADMQMAFDRYEDLREGAGKALLARVDVGMALLETHPGIGRVYFGEFRRLLVDDSPFGIFYVEEGRRVVVHAVLDMRMNPRTIKRRLQGR